jgi:hypothetical protein
MPPPFVFRDLDGLGRPLKAFLILAAFVALVAGVCAALHLRLLHQDSVTPAEAELDELRVLLVAVAQVLVLVPTYVLFAMWTYRAHANLRARGARGLRFTPGWAVGWLFVPIFSLWKPYQATKDLWRASQDPTDWQRLPVPSLLRIWWCAWALSITTAQYGFQRSARAGSEFELRPVVNVELTSGVLSVLAAVLAYFVVARIGAFQARLREQGDLPADVSGALADALD